MSGLPEFVGRDNHLNDDTETLGVLPQFVGTDEKTLSQFIQFAKQFVNVTDLHDMSTLSNIYWTGTKLLETLEPINIPNKKVYMEEIADVTQKAYKVIKHTLK